MCLCCLVTILPMTLSANWTLYKKLASASFHGYQSSKPTQLSVSTCILLQPLLLIQFPVSASAAQWLLLLRTWTSSNWRLSAMGTCVEPFRPLMSQQLSPVAVGTMWTSPWSRFRMERILWCTSWKSWQATQCKLRSRTWGCTTNELSPIRICNCCLIHLVLR